MKIVLCLFVVAAFVATGETLKCYQCSYTNPKCDAFDKSASGVVEKTCPPRFDRCLKSTATLSNGTSWTIRDCVPTHLVSPRAANVTYESEVTSFCSKDLCNGVSSTGAALTTLMVVIAPLIFKN